VNWRKLRIFVFTLLALCLIPATRYYQFDQPLLKWFHGSNRVDPLTLHLAGEFVENNLGTANDPDGSVTVRMIAEQYLFIPHCIVVPAGVPVHLRITSADAVHSFAIADSEYTVKALPGIITQAELKFSAPGNYKTECSEFCGAGHYAMRSEWKVVPADRFTPHQGGKESCAAQ
jgi:cytochrome c oxidase subunit 2